MCKCISPLALTHRPSLRFHIIADDEDFEVEGIRVRALAGKLYTNNPLTCS